MSLPLKLIKTSCLSFEVLEEEEEDEGIFEINVIEMAVEVLAGKCFTNIALFLNSSLTLTYTWQAASWKFHSNMFKKIMSTHSETCNS